MPAQKLSIKDLLTDRTWLATVLVSLSLPFYIGWTTITIVILLSAILLDAAARKRSLNIIHNWQLYWLVLLYILYAVSMIYTANKEEGLNNLSSSLSLVIFPVLLSGLDFQKPGMVKWVLNAFIAGCIAAGVYCLLSALITWLMTGENHFFYTQLSVYMHPSYFALMLNLCLCYLYNVLVFERDEKRQKPLLILCIFFINTLIILLSSKAGIFTAILVQLLVFAKAFSSTPNRKRIIYIFLGIAVFAFIFYKVIVPRNQERISDSEQQVLVKPLTNETSESSGVRLLIWKLSLSLAKENMPFGTGVGDVQDELESGYRDNGMTGALDKRLNAHNQFLQTLLATGIPGLVLLILSLLLPIIQGVRSGNFLFWVLPVIVAFNFLFESMLERQAGMVFFTFFMTLFILGNSKNKVSQAEP